MNSAFDIVLSSQRESSRRNSLPIKYQGTQKTINLEQLTQKINQQNDLAKKDVREVDRSIQAYFIGPQGQNIQYFTSLIKRAIDSHFFARVQYESQDARHISRKMKNQTSFLEAQDRLQKTFNKVLTKMKDLTPPFYSSRYFGHMNWETTIPSLVGNFATILYNPNNCAFEASPYTTILEIEVMKQFAKMFQLPEMFPFIRQANLNKQYSWGHLTCGGTVANCQAFWAARNCKFLGLSIRKYLQTLQNAELPKRIEVTLGNKSKKNLLQLSAWQILNIPSENLFKLYDQVYLSLYPQENHKFQNYVKYHKQISEFTIGRVGLPDMYEWLREINENKPESEWKGKIPKLKLFISAAGHYSMRKSLSILGIGQKAVEAIKVDLDSRISIKDLRGKLTECLQKKIPVISVVGIAGTTQESTIDNLIQISKLKKQFTQLGLNFHFHIDGAYGGYFVSLIREKSHSHHNSHSSYVEQQLRAFNLGDSITFDPHKTGYVPYSCGAIIYRNHRLRESLNFSAPVVFTGSEPNMSIYGIEGSKPGSSVTSVYLSLQVLPLVRGGHGQLLERTLINTKIFTANLYKICERQVSYKHNNGFLHEKFDCYLLPRLCFQKLQRPQLQSIQRRAIQIIYQSKLQNLQQKIRQGVNGQSLEQFYLNLGPDLNILCYGLNFYDQQTGQKNKSLKKYNQFNRMLIKLSKPVGTDVTIKAKALYLSSTQINRNTYGKQIFDDFLKRHNLQPDGTDQIVFIRSTIMNAFFTEPHQSEHSRLKESNKIFIKQILQNACETLLQLNWR